ncbi:glycosyltransferase [Flavobacterium sp. LHD-80]|uniref:glycosyltransferase family 2 protein n=1 Tax=Flavobacterium sp. LHD-80 TaxID=3071411 RepID=UPI0027DF2AAB|nr:glycosyltransferase [Flavobacterium sp. LHD-80]MDQ6472100.1 glycosyltransferase [Flavobacterium sp. LHD-80]
MIFSLVICTYMRPESLLALLESVQQQSLYPNEILIIDGSKDLETENVLKQKHFQNLNYFLVSEENRGLTRQRNFGISKLDSSSEIVCFLDDDTVLEQKYFEEIIKSFQADSNVVGVGGVAINENKWKLQDKNKYYNKKKFYLFEEYFYRESLRNLVRNYLGLGSNLEPGRMPLYSHAKPPAFPQTGKTYNVDLLIGMSMSFRKEIVEKIKFSKFFDGYSLYEDADFSLRALQFGKNVINTNVKLNHFHALSGRPNKYSYGKMVVKNGWYVWHVKNAQPVVIDRLKWHLITLLLIFLRFCNVFTSKKRKEAFTESLGRVVGWFQVLIRK